MKVKDWLWTKSPKGLARLDWEEYGYPQYTVGDKEWLDEYHEEFKRLCDNAIKIDEESWNAESK